MPPQQNPTDHQGGQDDQTVLGRVGNWAENRIINGILEGCNFLFQAAKAKAGATGKQRPSRRSSAS